MEKIGGITYSFNPCDRNIYQKQKCDNELVNANFFHKSGSNIMWNRYSKA